ncbi:hypothetical protein Hanom_Chr01g00094551 [Helianthus anomalus]
MRLSFFRPSLFCALRLGPRRGLCALSALSAFNNYDVNDMYYPRFSFFNYTSKQYKHERMHLF